MCAQGVNRYDKGKITKPISEYFQDQNKTLPNEIKIYYWPFPYKSHTMARDCALTDLSVKKPVLVWFLKFFPIAFLITFNEPYEYNFSLTELSQWRYEGIDFEIEVPVNLNDIVHQYWPEAPSKTSIIMYGQEAIVSFDWKKYQS